MAIAQLDEQEDTARHVTIGICPAVRRGAEFHAFLWRRRRLMCWGFRAPDSHTQGLATSECIGRRVGDEVGLLPIDLHAIMRPMPLAQRAFRKADLGPVFEDDFGGVVPDQDEAGIAHAGRLVNFAELRRHTDRATGIECDCPPVGRNGLLPSTGIGGAGRY